MSQLQTQKFDSEPESELSSEEDQEIPKEDFMLSNVPPRSIFRRRNYKFLKSEPKKVQF